MIYIIVSFMVRRVSAASLEVALTANIASTSGAYGTRITQIIRFQSRALYLEQTCECTLHCVITRGDGPRNQATFIANQRQMCVDSWAYVFPRFAPVAFI